MASYLDNVSGSTIEDLKENKDFQKDLVRFLSSDRINFSIDELREGGVDFMVDEYVEHMRGQDANEVTALRDLSFAKDTTAREQDRLAFGRLMETWDKVDGVGTGFIKGAGDYGEAILTSPATLASVFTGGYSKLGAVAATKATQLATRAAVKRIMSKEFAVQAAKGFATTAVVEGGLTAGQVEVQESARENTIENYEGMSLGEKAFTIGLGAGFGGTVGGLSRGLSIKQADQVAENLMRQSATIAADKQATAKIAVKKLSKVGSTAQGRKKVNNILNKMNGLVDILGQRDAKKNPLDPKKVAEGLDIKKNILTEGPNINVTTGLSRHTLQGITAAALEIADIIKLKDGERISTALAQAMDDGVINTKNIDKIITDYGLTKEEFGYVFLSDLSEAGRTLGAAGQVAKQIKRSELNEVLDKIEGLSDQGVGVYNDRLAKEVSATIGVEQGKFGTAVEVLRQADSARIAFMTSQIGTTAANAMFSTARVGIDVVDEVFRQTLRTGYTFATTGKIPISNFRAVTSGLRSMSWNKQDALMIKEMYKRDFPEEYQKIFYDINRAEVSVGSDTVVGKIGSFVNLLNSAVDSRFKQAAFYSSLDRQLIESGEDGLRGFLSKNNSLLDLPDQAMKDKAVYDSLDFVFQKGYKKEDALGIPRAVINLHKKAPFVVSGFLGMPFPRYVANHMEFINDYTPIAFVTGGRKNFDKVYAGTLKDPTERIARQMTGISLISGAVYARASQVEFDDEGKAIGMKTAFADMQFGEAGQTKKLGRVAGALAAHQLLGDLIVRYHYGLPMPKISETTRNVLDVAGGLGNMGFDKGLESDIRKAFDEGDFGGGLGRRVADIMATFTYPVTVLKDLQGQINPEASYVPYTRNLMLGNGVQEEHNLLAAMFTDTESINRLVRFLPETDLVQYTQSLDSKKSTVLYDPIGGGPVRSRDPITKQLLGIDTRKAPNTLQKNINNLNLKEFLLYRKSQIRNPSLDILVRYGLSKTLNSNFEDYISKPLKEYDNTMMFSEASPDEQAMLVKNFINKEVKATETRIEMYFEELSNRSPRGAASYIRNVFHLEMQQAKPGVTERSVNHASSGKFNSVDDYINDSENITEELERKQQIIQLNTLQEQKMNM